MTPDSTSNTSKQPLFKIVYVSSAAHPFSADELLALLKRARPRNTAAGVTGLLLYHDGNFIQCLEGPEPEVKATHQRILSDPRHYGHITLIAAPATERLFPDSSMGFRKIAPSETNKIPGFSDFLSQTESREPPPQISDKALRLLYSFRARIR